MASNLISFFLSKEFRRNILVMCLITLFIITIAYLSLGIYTDHGETVTVPDLKGLTYEQLENFAQSRDFRFTVLDSTFVKGMPPRAIVDQNPKPNEKVKQNRRIYLTLNSLSAPLVKLPDLTSSSQRNAQSLLESVGLEVGNITNKPSQFKNLILEVSFMGKPVVPGEEVAKGSKIDLVVGNGFGSTEMDVPDLIGLSLLEAKVAIKGYNLNVGMILPDPGVKEDDNAVVYKQNPEPGTPISQGQPIELFIQNGAGVPPPSNTPPTPIDEETLPPDIN